MKLFEDRSDRRAIIWLVIISVITHFKWLLSMGIFTSGDWWYIGAQRYRDFRQFSPIWVSDGFGGTSAVPPFYFIRFLEGMVAAMGGNFALNEKLFFFIPLTFCSTLGAYLFLRNYFRVWPAFVGAIIYAFNTALLFNYAGALTIGVGYAMAPLVLFLLQRYLEQPRNTRWLFATGLALSIMAAYEQRMALIAIMLGGGLFVFNTFVVANSKAYFLPRLVPLAKLGGLIIALHAFWLLPYAINARSGVTFSDLLNRGLFVSFSDIQNGLTLFHPFWTGQRPATFIVQDIPLYAWILPLAAFGGFFVPVRNKVLTKHKAICYWAGVGLLGIFLVKQVNEPFADSYPWLFGHVPGFGAFREGSKFYLLVALSYAVLVPFTLTSIKQWCTENIKNFGGWPVKRMAIVATSALVLGLFAINIRPLLTGELRTTYIPRKMPQDYQVLETFVSQQPEHFRILWVPVNSRWGIQSNTHPALLATQVNSGVWLSQLGVSGDPQRDMLSTLRDKAMNLFSQSSTPDMLARANVKYVVVPTRDTANEDDFFRYYGDDRQYYIDILDKTPYLKKLDIGTKDLAVYENPNYQPYISSFTDLQSVNMTPDTDVDPLHSLITKDLNAGFNITNPTNDTPEVTAPATAITDIYQDVLPDNVQQGGVTKTFKTGQNPYLYINQSSRHVRYEIKDKQFQLYGQTGSGLTIDGNMTDPLGKEKLLADTSLDSDQAYYLEVDGKVMRLDQQDTQHDLGFVTGALGLYTAAGNILDNPSFEQDLWQSQVQDCNAYDNNPYISMRQDHDLHSEGAASLRLESDLHTACTDSQPVPNTSRAYLLSLDYRIEGGRNAGFEVTFDDPAHTKIKQDLATSRQIWQTHQQVIQAPAEATSFTIRLLGYPDYRLRNHAITNYDNLSMMPLQTVSELAASPTNYRQVQLPPTKTVAITQPIQNTGVTNLVPNPTFDESLWQKAVSDCDAYDDRPSIGMAAIKHERGKALQLKARHHNACTSQGDIPITGNNTYLLGFDFQSPNAHAAHYTIEFNDPNQSTLEGHVPVKGSDWQTFTKRFKAPLGATKMKLTLLAYSNAEGINDFINNYDNVSVQALPTPAGQYYLVDRNQAKLTAPASTTYLAHGPTKRTIQVKGASTPFYISMSEAYNPLWQLRLNNQGRLASLNPRGSADSVSAHLKLQDFQNGWYVDPATLCQNNKAGCTKNADGSYNIDLVAEFRPQRWFYMGLLISAPVFAGVIIYLGYAGVLRIQQKHKRYWRWG
jgi:hypothetical protein